MRIYRKSDDKMQAVYMSLIGLAITGMFSYPFNYPSIYFMFFFNMGLISANEPLKWRINGKFVTILIILLGIGTLSFSLYRKKLETRWFLISRRSLVGNSKHMLPYYNRLYPFLRGDAMFLYNYGAELHAAEHWQESIHILMECSTGINDTDVQLLLADNYEQLRDYLQAERCLLLASRMCPNRFLPLYRLVKLYQETNRKNEALQLAQHIVQKPVKIPSYTIEKIKQEMQRYIQDFCKD